MRTEAVIGNVRACHIKDGVSLQTLNTVGVLSALQFRLYDINGRLLGRVIQVNNEDGVSDLVFEVNHNNWSKRK